MQNNLQLLIMGAYIGLYVDYDKRLYDIIITAKYYVK